MRLQERVEMARDTVLHLQQRGHIFNMSLLFIDVFGNEMDFALGISKLSMFGVRARRHFQQRLEQKLVSGNSLIEQMQ